MQNIYSTWRALLVRFSSCDCLQTKKSAKIFKHFWSNILSDIQQIFRGYLVDIVSQLIRIGPLLTDSLCRIKESLGQFLTGLPRFLLK